MQTSFVVFVQRVIRSTAFVVLPVVLLACSVPVSAQVAQEEPEDQEAGRVSGGEGSSGLEGDQDAAAREKDLRKLDSYRGVTEDVEQRRRTEDAQILSLWEFLGKYNEFARKVKVLLEAMQTNPSVVPVAKLREVQKAWVAWQKCREWSTSK